MTTDLLEPIARESWNGDRARHLLQRAGFGIPARAVQFLARLSPEEAVDHLVFYERQGESVPEPDFLPPPTNMRRLRESLRSASPEERQRRVQELRRAEREAVASLQAWWLERMATTACPLREKMTLFWHGHFATSAQKVRSAWFNYRLNAAFRTHATGNFKALTQAVAQSPAMLRYLDNVRSTRRQPNENWARELLELFTLGPGHYTEDDIKNAARAFTGWSANENGFLFRAATHDFGPKTFLGRPGNLNGTDILDIVFEQPATAKFICGKLWAFFVHEDPPPAAVRELAKTFREHRYELKPVLRRMFLSRAFYSERVVGTQVKSPVQFVLQLCDHIGVDAPPYPRLAQATARLGQNLFYPPNVKGWEGNRAWINANTFLMRCNLPPFLAAARRAPAAMAARASVVSDSPMPQPQEAPQTGRNAFAGAQFSTVGDCLAFIEKRFLSVELSTEQKAILAEALGVPSDEAAPLRPADLRGPQVRAALHLLLSTAEYQLC